SAWVVTAAAGSAVATAKPRARCFRRMAVFLPFCASLRNAFLLALVRDARTEGTRPAEGAGAGVRVECAPSIRKGPHLPGLIFELVLLVFLLGATISIPKVRQ